MPPSAPEPSPGLTLDELAEKSGVPARTIRFYRQSGLVATPTRVGRHVYYDEGQVARLELISELRTRGLGLDAIEAVLADPDGARETLAQLLHAGDELRKPWIDDAPAQLTILELRERIGSDDPAIIDALELYTMVVREGGPGDPVYHVPSTATLELAIDIATGGFDIPRANAAFVMMQEHISVLAHALVQLVTDPVEGSERPPTLDELMEAFNGLRPIALQAIELVFAHEIEQALREFVASGGMFALAPPAERTSD